MMIRWTLPVMVALAAGVTAMPARLPPNAVASFFPNDKKGNRAKPTKVDDLTRRLEFPVN